MPGGRSRELADPPATQQGLDCTAPYGRSFVRPKSAPCMIVAQCLHKLSPGSDPTAASVLSACIKLAFHNTHASYGPIVAEVRTHAPATSVPVVADPGFTLRTLAAVAVHRRSHPQLRAGARGRAWRRLLARPTTRCSGLGWTWTAWMPRRGALRCTAQQCSRTLTRCGVRSRKQAHSLQLSNPTTWRQTTVPVRSIQSVALWGAGHMRFVLPAPQPFPAADCH